MDSAPSPEVWARQAAARLATGVGRLDEESLRQDLLEVWRAAVVADQGLGPGTGPAPTSGSRARLVRRPADPGCPPEATHLKPGPGSAAVHLQPDPRMWSPIPGPAPEPTPESTWTATRTQWAASTAATFLEGMDHSERHEPFLRTRLLAMPPNRSPDLHASLSFVHHADLRLARLDITLRPGARNDHERRRVLGVDAGSDRAGGIDYYAHRSLGPAQRVLRFNPPGPTELGDNGPGSMKILWRLDESTDLLVSLDTRCAEKLLTLLPAVDVLLETLQVCPPPPPVDPAQDLQTRHGPAPGKPVRALDPELISRYQVFAEHFVRGMRRLPPDLEDYRPLLEGTRQATESELAELREAANWPDGPFKDTPLLLLLHTFDAGSGLDRVDPMTYHTVGGSFAVFAGKGGTRLLPDWYQNLLLNPEGSIEIGTRTIEVKARVLDAERREAIWQEQKTRYPGLADYETNTRPVIPVVMLDRR